MLEKKSIGLLLRLSPKTGNYVVDNVAPGGLADRSGQIRTGDEILEINRRPLQGCGPAELSAICAVGTDKDIQVKYVRGGEVSEILLQVQGLFHARHNGAGLEDDLKSTIRKTAEMEARRLEEKVQQSRNQYSNRLQEEVERSRAEGSSRLELQIRVLRAEFDAKLEHSLSDIRQSHNQKLEEELEKLRIESKRRLQEKVERYRADSKARLEAQLEKLRQDSAQRLNQQLAAEKDRLESQLKSERDWLTMA